MGVEEVTDGHLEARREFRLEVAREVAIDRVRHDDAFGRHQEHRVVVVVLRAVELSGDVHDAAGRRFLLRECARDEACQPDDGDQHEGQDASHDELLGEA